MRQAAVASLGERHPRAAPGEAARLRPLRLVRELRLLGGRVWESLVCCAGLGQGRGFLQTTHECDQYSSELEFVVLKGLLQTGKKYGQTIKNGFIHHVGSGELL